MGVFVVRKAPVIAGSALFTDNFNSGSLAGPQNGISWGSANIGPGDGSIDVVSGVGYAGTAGLRFRYLGTGSDRQVEQRMDFVPGFNTAIWMRFKFWVPADYYHSGATNDKFWLAVWGGPYNEPTTPGMDINFWGRPDGLSSATVYFFNQNWSAHTWGTDDTLMIRAVDRGAWMQVVIGYELPLAVGQYGRVRIWRDPGVTGTYTKVIDVNSNDATADSVPQGSNYVAGQTYLDQAYLMGWANSPQTNTMDYVMDDVEFSNSNIFGAS